MARIAAGTHPHRWAKSGDTDDVAQEDCKYWWLEVCENCDAERIGYCSHDDITRYEWICNSDGPCPYAAQQPAPEAQQ